MTPFIKAAFDNRVYDCLLAGGRDPDRVAHAYEAGLEKIAFFRSARPIRLNLRGIPTPQQQIQQGRNRRARLATPVAPPPQAAPVAPPPQATQAQPVEGEGRSS